MMYQAFDSSKELLHPVNYIAKTISNTRLLNNKILRKLPQVKHLKASAKIVERVTRRYSDPGFCLNHTTIDGQDYPVTEHIAVSRPFCNLVQFKREGSENDPSVLIVAPLAGHYASLTRDTINNFLPDYNVYATDWQNARDVPLEEGEFSFDRFVEYVIDFVKFLGPGSNLISACQPCPGVLTAATVMAMDDDPAQPTSMVLMAGPVDPRINQVGILKTATDKLSAKLVDRFAIDTVPAQYKGRGRRVYGGFRQLSFFMALNMPLHARKHYNFYMDVVKGNDDAAEAHETFYDDYFAMIDGDAKFYMDTIEKVFTEFHLPRGLMEYKGKKIDTAAITKIGLMTVEGGKDNFCPPGQTEAAHVICPNIPSEMRKQHVQEDVGHYGVFNGSKFRDSIAPKIKAFFEKNTAAKKAAAPKEDPKTAKEAAAAKAPKKAAAAKPAAKPAAVKKSSKTAKTGTDTFFK
jgi:poly(3-hydroxybutyrate) depolymerase